MPFAGLMKRYVISSPQCLPVAHHKQLFNVATKLLASRLRSIEFPEYFVATMASCILADERKSSFTLVLLLVQKCLFSLFIVRLCRWSFTKSFFSGCVQSQLCVPVPYPVLPDDSRFFYIVAKYSCNSLRVASIFCSYKI